MTEVTAAMRRAFRPDMFVDVTGEGVQVSIAAAGLLFDADLTPEQVDAIWWRMTSRDDTDEANRRNLASLRDTLTAADLSTPEGLDALRAATVAAIDYLLGDA